MFLHISSGRILLYNTDDSLWYYVFVEILNGFAYLRVSQAGKSYTGTPYKSYGVLYDSVADQYYKFSLQTYQDKIQSEFSLLYIPEQPDLLLVVGTDDLYYRIVLDRDNKGDVYGGVSLYDPSIINTIDSGFPTLVPVIPLSKTVIIVPSLV